MIEDPYSISVILIYSAVGSFIRSLFGIYKSYSSVDVFRLNVRKLLVEFCTSMIIGTFGVVILSELGGYNYGLKLFAIIGGLFGADILSMITKKVGLTKGLNVMRMTDDEIKLVNFNGRQINAIDYLRRNKIMTKREYEKLNQTSNDCAKRDLTQLVKKKKIKKYGTGKAIFYKLP